MRPTTEERFWSKVNVDGPVSEYRPDLGRCWIWQNKPNNSGYGFITVAGVRIPIGAHRYAYELIIGVVPAGMDLDHLCRVRLCVNPFHLEPVTRLVNLMRGSSPAGVNAQRTHCVNGHELTEENTYRYLLPSGNFRRTCKPCALEGNRRRYAARRAARPSNVRELAPPKVLQQVS